MKDAFDFIDPLPNEHEVLKTPGKFKAISDEL